MINVASILSKIESHAMSLGRFERVNRHEPKNAPGNGLTCAIWIQEIGPVPSGSGLTVTTGRLAFMERLYSNMIQEPQDAIDPNIIEATDALMGAYSVDFDFSIVDGVQGEPTIRNIDLLGQAGTPLSARAGYVNISNVMYRAMDISLPLIVNDIWTQGA